ncbi:hypothetical protein HAX54_030488, partial [Datura stramonium]|nr:hypothetical protein [Datura stramonium]
MSGEETPSTEWDCSSCDRSLLKMKLLLHHRLGASLQRSVDHYSGSCPAAAVLPW